MGARTCALVCFYIRLGGIWSEVPSRSLKKYIRSADWHHHRYPNCINLRTYSTYTKTTIMWHTIHYRLFHCSCFTRAFRIPGTGGELGHLPMVLDLAECGIWWCWNKLGILEVSPPFEVDSWGVSFCWFSRDLIALRTKASSCSSKGVLYFAVEGKIKSAEENGSKSSFQISTNYPCYNSWRERLGWKHAIYKAPGHRTIQVMATSEKRDPICFMLIILLFAWQHPN